MDYGVLCGVVPGNSLQTSCFHFSLLALLLAQKITNVDFTGDA